MSKILIKTACLFVSLTLFLACQAGSDAETNPNSPVNRTETQTYKSTGVIKKIDAEKGEITIDHEDIPGYMSAMEMTEPVADKKMLEPLKAGDKVDFEIERTGPEVIVTKIAKTGGVLSGSEIFKTNCAECHGEKGEGAKKGIPLVSGHALHHSESEYVEQVKNGEEDKMPAFRDKLSEEEIAGVVKYVRETLQKNSSAGEEKHQHGH
ncbi:MAG: copper-binding protein [Pyrinomonadaceae bacterium]